MQILDSRFHGNDKKDPISTFYEFINTGQEKDAAMDVEFINAFMEGTVNVLKTMAFIEPKPGAPYIKKE